MNNELKKAFGAVLLLAAAVQVRAALYIVGSAINTGWDRQPMTEQGSGVYTWEGYLFHGGELKFMTEASDWGDHWGPSAANTLLGMGTQGIALHTSGDYKYRVDNVGLCRVQVDTNTKQIQVADPDGNLPPARQYPPCLYPIGTAVGTAFGEGNDYALREDHPDAGTYSGTLTLTSGTMALHSKPYMKDAGARTISPLPASGATVKLPKLRYSIETDKCSYAPGETVTLTMTPSPPSGTRIRYRHMGDIIADTLLTSRNWTWTPPAEDFQGYLVEAYRPEEAPNAPLASLGSCAPLASSAPSLSDKILATIAVDVSSDWTRFPRYGFVATFGSDKTLTKTRTEMKWLNRCHINGVQFQDWHYCHDWPLGGTREGGLWTSYKDIANRTIYTSAVKNYIKAQHDRGMKSIFYNLCFGVLDGWEQRGVKPEWFIFKDKNHTTHDKHDLPDSWKSDIYLVNPGNPEWLEYMAERNDEVYSFLDFDGYQIDQLGGRGTVYDYYGNSLNLRDGFAPFISSMKRRHPDKRLVMNAVGQWGVSQIAGSGKVDFLYSEVWGNQEGNSLTSGKGRFANIKSVIDENLGQNPALRSVLAAYMNYLTDNKDFNTPGVVMADAVMFALGGSHLELGGDHMLCSEYFPSNDMKWHSQIEDWMTRYYDFMTAYENLLRDPWTEKTGVKAACSAVTINTWEPVANQVTMLAREVNGRRVVHLLNFTREDNAADVTDDYMLCWHDNMATRPWPKRFENLTVRLTGMSGMGKVRRVWVATPDYCGGAVQELTDYKYYSSSGTITLTVPSLQFWTMIVVEPETATTKDNTCYAPSTDGESLEPGTVSSLQPSTAPTRTWSLLLEDGTYQAYADIPAGTLTLQRDNEDAITLPLSEDGAYGAHGAYGPNGPGGGGGGAAFFTPAGLPASSTAHGLLLGKGKKVFR